MLVTGRRIAATIALCIVVGWGVVPALGADECGAGVTASCTSAGNNYTSGITYGNANQSVTLQSGVVVNSGANVGVSLTGTGTQTLNMTSGVTVTTNGSVDGVSILNATGLLSISAAGTTVSAGTATGFNLQSSGAIDATVGDVTGTVRAIATGTGTVSVTTGAVSTSADNATAVFGQGSGGTVTIDTTGGLVSTGGGAATGVEATFSGSSGSATITTGDVTTQGNLSNGVAGFTKGPNNALTIDTTAGTITTHGANAPGIDAATGNFPFSATNTGLLTIRAGKITTTGDGSVGITANAFGGDMDITAGGAITTTNGDGIDTSAANFTGVNIVTITVNGSISAGGATSTGINAGGFFGFANVITVNGSVGATGASGVGILSGGDSGDQITVNPGGSVSGNTGIEFFDFSPTTLTNSGTITGAGGTAVNFLGGASDTFTNNGTVNGSVLLGDGDDTAILNTGSSISGTLDGGAGTDTLKLGGTGSSTLDLSPVTNFEIFDKIDSGTWTLTGTGTFSTSATVSAGMLSINGSLTSPVVTVDSGATLGGTGTIIGAVTVNGTVAPGNSIGTLHVTGSYAQGAGSVYAVQLNPSSSDLISITGTATVDGTAAVHITATNGTYTVGQQFTILSATGGVTGQYGSLTDNLAFVDFALSADANDIFLDVTAAAAPLDQIARTPNERAAARGLLSLGAGHAPFDAVTALTIPDAIHAFDLLSGEIHSSVVSVLLNDSGELRDAILGRLRQSVGGASAIFAPNLATLDYGRRPPTQLADAGDPPLAQQKAAQADRGLTAWATPFGGFGHNEGDDNAASLNRSTSGVIAGIDATFVSSGVWRFGIAAGYQGSNVEVADRDSSANIGTYHVATYAGTQQGPFGLRFGGSYSGHGIYTRRAVVFPGFAETERASYDGSTLQGFGEAGYTLAFGRVAFEPFAGLAYVDIRTDPFGESGGTAALHSPGAGADTLYSSLGVRTAVTLPWRGIEGNLILKGSASWQHGFGTIVPTASLAFSGASPFTVAGVPIAANEAKIELGLDTRLAVNATFGVAYTGQLAGNAQDHQFSANLAVRF